MPKVTFEPMNIVVEATPGQSVLEVALTGDIPIQHACGGFCACATCHIIVKSGGGSLDAMDADENERLEIADGRQGTSRLACQTKVRNSDLVVHVVNID